MKALICPATGRVDLVEVPEPVIGPQEILLRLRVCGICGTDLMKVYNKHFAKPVQLGHEVVGTVDRIGEDVHTFFPGQRVAVAHHVPDYSSHYSRRGSEPMDPQFKQSNIDPGGFAEFIRLPAAHVRHTTRLVPNHVPDLRAVFMEPLACCLRALQRCPVVAGDTVLIIGVGTVGLLFVPLLRDRTAAVFVVDLREERLVLAKEWGAVNGFLADGDAWDEIIRRQTGGRGADLVVLTVIDESTWETAQKTVRDGGTIMIFGAKPGKMVSVNLWKTWRREINILTSYSATPDLLPRAMAILSRSDYPLENTISHEFILEDSAKAFALAYHGQTSKVVIHGT